MKIYTLVVDNNASWRKTIGKFVDMHPLLELVDTCDSAMDAYAKMKVHDIDLLVCDIEMPDKHGSESTEWSVGHLCDITRRICPRLL
ncbi:response regulator [Spirosoma fluviale]|uniref:response regulator n=1 Tax=Spirosoma fluviale TaxID=1597977 RepID=UPI001FEB9C71|nr:response regulator [Spirosoma fluviale]